MSRDDLFSIDIKLDGENWTAFVGCVYKIMIYKKAGERYEKIIIAANKELLEDEV